MSSESGFNFYCYGEVSVDKPEDTNVIEVFPKDIMYNLDGEIDNREESIIINRTSADGKVKTDKISTKNVIAARWLALGGSNRVSAPDVRKGETVLVFRYGTNDDYYWEPITTETTKRGKETVTYLFKNTDSQDQVNENNSYFLTFSTRHKFIHLHTSNNDGEAVAYDLLMDTKQGTVTLKDSRNNSIELRSTEDYLKVKTNKKIDMETQELNILASKKMTIKTPDLNISATQKMAIATPDLYVDAAKFLQKDTSYTLTTSSYSLSSGASQMTSSGSDGFNYSSKITVTDLVTVTDLKTNSIPSINGHKHKLDSGGSTDLPF